MCTAVLDANRAPEPVMLPERLELEDDSWREVAPLELYVDFETVSSMADDFSALPMEGGLPLIFQIGCGRIEDGAWRFDQWTVERLTEASEVAIIDAWVARVRELCDERGIGIEEARLYHWSPAETSTLTTAYNAARTRHSANQWPLLPWFDLLDRVVEAGPISVTGAFGYGLKDIAKAMQAMGLIQTAWGDGPDRRVGRHGRGLARRRGDRGVRRRAARRPADAGGRRLQPRGLPGHGGDPGPAPECTLRLEHTEPRPQEVVVGFIQKWDRRHIDNTSHPGRLVRSTR